MINIKQGTNNNSITIGNGDKIKSVSVGQIKGAVTTKIGQIVASVVLKEVAYIPQSKFNLLLLTKMMSKGWKMIGNKQSLTIEKDGVTIAFDIIIKTQRGRLYCLNIQRYQELEVATMDVSKEVVHKLLGHSNADATVKTATHLG